MKIKYLLAFLFSFVALQNVFAQGSNCGTADPFCTSNAYTFANNTGVADGGAFDCLATTPNPAWYYLQISTSGNIVIDISQTDATGTGTDVDFAVWGPFTNLTAACATNFAATSTVDCSYSTAAVETATINGAVAGQWYMFLLTNYADVPGTINFSANGSSTGATNCNILCTITAMTAVPGACNPATNQFSTTGVISTTNPPTSGTLTITNSCGGAPQVTNAPFSATTNYTFSGLNANGAACQINASYSADPTCVFTTNYTAPAACNVTPVCAITSVTAVASACNPADNSYSTSGVVNSTNAPATGNLTITNSCGGTPQVVAAPFAAAINYSFTGLTSNAANCTVTAAFSAVPACTLTSNYTAPANCVPVCAITSVSSTPSACSIVDNSYTVSGTINSTNAPATGTLDVTNSCGGVPQSFPAPFAASINYSFNSALSSNGANCIVTAAFSATPACTLTSNYTAPVNCIPPPTCVATAANTGPYCAGTTISLSSTPVGAAVYSWTGPNGFTSNVANPTILNCTSANGGTYTVTVTEANGAVCTATTVVVITPSPLAPTVANLTYCLNSTAVPLTATPSAGGTLNWYGTSSIGGTASATAPTPATNVLGLVTYYVSQTVNGCEGPRAAIDVTTGNQPPPGTTNVIYCVNATATPLIATPAAGGVLNWYGTNATGGTASATAPTPSTTTVGSSVYYVSQTIAGCESPRATLSVTIVPPPSAPATANLTYCLNATAPALTATGVAGSTLNWYGTNATGGVGSITATVPTTSAVGTISYYVSQSLGGCESPRGQIDVTITPLPIVTSVSTPLIGCAPLLGDVVVVPNPTTSLVSIDFGAGNVVNNDSAANLTYLIPGSYGITVNLTDPQGCTNTFSYANQIVVHPDPVANFDFSPIDATILDPTIHFVNQSTGAVSYDWNFQLPYGDSSALPNPHYTYDSVGVYTVQLIVESVNGCLDTTEKTVIIYEDFTLYVPNSFSPNGDLRNDVFLPLGIGIDPASYEMWIFDRWGVQTFYTNDLSKGWDGTMQGKGGTIVQEDVYIWKIKCKAIAKKEKKNIAGHVTVVK